MSGHGSVIGAVMILGVLGLTFCHAAAPPSIIGTKVIIPQRVHIPSCLDLAVAQRAWELYMTNDMIAYARFFVVRERIGHCSRLGNDPSESPNVEYYVVEEYDPEIVDEKWNKGWVCLRGRGQPYCGWTRADILYTYGEDSHPLFDDKPAK